MHEQLSTQIHHGRDRLLELASHYEPQADALQQALQQADQTGEWETYVPALLDAFGVGTEPFGDNCLLLDPEYLATDALPGIGDGPRQATFSRATALVREDLQLLRADHPLVAGAMDILLSGELGNSTFMIDEDLPSRSAILQAVFVLECVTDRTLDVARFLPPLPLVASVDSRLAERARFEPSQTAMQRSRERRFDIHRYRKILTKLIPPLLQRAEALAQERAQAAAATALADARASIADERARLQALHAVNPAVSTSQIQTLDTELATLERDIPRARLRLDSLRFVASTDFLRLR